MFKFQSFILVVVWSPAGDISLLSLLRICSTRLTLEDKYAYHNTIQHVTTINRPIHDDVIKWKHFPRNWPFVRGIHCSQIMFQRDVSNLVIGNGISEWKIWLNRYQTTTNHRGAILLTLFNLIRAWMNNHMYRKWNEITYPFPNFNGLEMDW